MFGSLSRPTLALDKPFSLDVGACTHAHMYARSYTLALMHGSALGMGCAYGSCKWDAGGAGFIQNITSYQNYDIKNECWSCMPGKLMLARRIIGIERGLECTQYACMYESFLVQVRRCGLP